MTTIWQIDKTSCNARNIFCIKVELLESVNKNRIIIKHPIEPRMTRVMAETEKYIFLTTEKALAWLRITLSFYKFDTEYWNQTIRKIRQIEANEQCPLTYIRQIYESQKFVKKSHFSFHYDEVGNDTGIAQSFESKINQ